MNKICKIEGCSSQLLSRGLCSKHYSKAKNKGTFGGVKCNFEGCLCLAYGLGFCIKHYTRLKRYGDPSFSNMKRGEDRSNNYLYGTYCQMKARCYSQKRNAYKRYGGRGIEMCSTRLGIDGFSKFLIDMGDRPTDKHSIDRIDVNGNYCKENCRRSTQKEQLNNTRRTIIYNGEPASKAQVRLGLGKGSISNRIKLGRSIEKAFATPFLPNDKSRKHMVII